MKIWSSWFFSDWWRIFSTYSTIKHEIVFVSRESKCVFLQETLKFLFLWLMETYLHRTAEGSLMFGQNLLNMNVSCVIFIFDAAVNSSFRWRIVAVGWYLHNSCRLPGFSWHSGARGLLRENNVTKQKASDRWESSGLKHITAEWCRRMMAAVSQTESRWTALHTETSLCKKKKGKQKKTIWPQSEVKVQGAVGRNTKCCWQENI